eukprot:gene16812-23094_t
MQTRSHAAAEPATEPASEEFEDELVEEEESSGEGEEGLDAGIGSPLSAEDDEGEEDGEEEAVDGDEEEEDEDEEEEEDMGLTLGGDDVSDDDGDVMDEEMDADDEEDSDDGDGPKGKGVACDGGDVMDEEMDADDEEDSDHDGDDSDGGGPKGKGLSFNEGGKGESFSKAFAKIMQSKVKRAKMDPDAVVAGVIPDPELILANSSSVQKRKADESEAGKANRALKKAKLEMKKRGHAPVTKKGEDPALDLKEKQFAKMATKGVVILFNAVSKAQKQVDEAKTKTGIGAASKAAKLNKASFLAQLKASATGQDGAEKKGVPAGAPVVSQDASAGGPGWKVLQESFTGLSGGTKMKDWDKEVEEDSDMEPTGIAGGDSSGDGDDGW